VPLLAVTAPATHRRATELAVADDALPAAVIALIVVAVFCVLLSKMFPFTYSSPSTPRPRRRR